MDLEICITFKLIPFFYSTKRWRKTMSCTVINTRCHHSKTPCTVLGLEAICYRCMSTMVSDERQSRCISKAMTLFRTPHRWEILWKHTIKSTLRITINWSHSSKTTQTFSMQIVLSFQTTQSIEVRSNWLTKRQRKGSKVVAITTIRWTVRVLFKID